MTRSELVGYVRKSNAGNALKLNILKSALNEAPVVEGKDGTEYVSLIMNLSKIKMIIGDEHEVTSICQIYDDEVPEIKKKTKSSTDDDEDEDAEASSDSSSCSCLLGDGRCDATGCICPHPEDEAYVIKDGQLCPELEKELTPLTDYITCPSYPSNYL